MNTRQRMRAAGLALAHGDIETAYARWAPVYDLFFAELLRPGRRAAAEAACRTEGLILDVGCGTGLELPFFDRRRVVTGVDLSEPMLRRAAQRIRRERLAQVVGLCRMDATRLAFPDRSFGCVVAPYVLTVAPEPLRMLDELTRVLCVGGHMVLVNHVSSDDTPFADVEAWIGRRFASKLGWRPEFPWSIIGDWIDGRADMRLIERRLLPPFGLFTLTRIERIRSEPREAAEPPQEKILEPAP